MKTVARIEIAALEMARFAARDDRLITVAHRVGLDPHQPEVTRRDGTSDSTMVTQPGLVQRGLTNLSVIRSLSPIAAYLARSTSLRVKVGGRVHTPLA